MYVSTSIYLTTNLYRSIYLYLLSLSLYLHQHLVLVLIWISTFKSASKCVSKCESMPISLSLSLSRSPPPPLACRRGCARAEDGACDSIRSVFDSAAVSTDADKKAEPDFRPDSRADRPRRYRPVSAAPLHACALGSVRLCSATLCAALFCSQRVCAMSRRCASRGTAGIFGIYSSRTATRAAAHEFVGFARVGRRRHVEMPYDYRAVGWPSWAHDCGRRRQRHLRHRRVGQFLHLLQGRVGEHRRRCGPDSVHGGLVGGVLVGYLMGTTGGYSKGSLGIPTGFAPGRPTHARISVLHPCRSPSAAAHVNAAADAITCMACMSLGKNWVRVASCGRERPRVCRCACVCACACACLLVCLCARACTACVNERTVRAPRGSMRPPIARPRRAVSIARPAPCVAAARVVAVCATGRARASAAGVTWTSRTAKAQWAGRYGHTSVVDAAGAIYVIGGSSSGGYPDFLNDVWASTDGGARPASVGGCVGWYPGGTRG
jgi:hypothetical protein